MARQRREPGETRSTDAAAWRTPQPAADPHYTPAAAPEPTPEARPVTPHLHAEDVQERRTLDDRRVDDLQVVEERRLAERRAQRVASQDRRRYGVARATQAVDYIFLLLYGLLGIRFLLSLMGASESAGFVRFVYGVTQPFYAPFSGMISRPGAGDGFFDFPLLIAILAYALLHAAVRGLLRLAVANRHTV